MDIGYYKFHRSKKKSFIILLSMTLAITTLVIRAFDLPPKIEENLSLFKIVVIVAICLFLGLFFILTNKPFIEITPGYIKIGGCEKLYWTDIERLEMTEKIVNGHSFIFYNLWPRNIEKYRLTYLQKMNLKMKCSPFCLGDTLPLSRDDWQKLINVLKERIPNNNLGSLEQNSHN